MNGMPFNKLGLSPIQIRVFIGSFLAMFLIVSLQYLGVRPPKLIIPTAEKKVDIFQNILPNLQHNRHTFSLQKGTSFVPQVYAVSDYDKANAYAVIDFKTGEVITKKNLSEKVPIASLTKIMTAITALDLASADEYFTVSQKAAKIEPTKIGVVPGEKMALSELLQAMMLTSANDAAQVIKEGIDQKYGEHIFIRAMNEKAAFLHLQHSHFTNPQGFDNASHFSSVEDLALLTHYAITTYPLFREIVRKDYAQLPRTAYHKQFDLYNWNGLLGVYPDVSGVKIGNTDAAGKTTVVLSKRDGQEMLVVLLGAPGVLERDLWAAQLLDTGFQARGLASVNITEEQLREKYSTWKYWN